MNFTENLRVLREKNGMTQEQLAEQMDVSRQTISKWESGTSMPELDKLVQLTDIFGCTMDGLLKGNLILTSRKESELYDKHGNWIAKRGATATGICIISLALQLIGEYINPSFLGESGLPFLIVALVGALLWVNIGMSASYFRIKHPYIEPFYTEDEKESFHQQYVTHMIIGIGILIMSIILMSTLYTLWDVSEAKKDAFGGSLFFTMVAAGVMLIVYTALMASKYNVEQYNADNAWDMSEEGKANAKRIGTACGAIMLAAAGICIVLGMMHVGHVLTAIPLVVGGCLCGVACMVLNKRKG